MWFSYSQVFHIRCSLNMFQMPLCHNPVAKLRNAQFARKKIYKSIMLWTGCFADTSNHDFSHCKHRFIALWQQHSGHTMPRLLICRSWTFQLCYVSRWNPGHYAYATLRLLDSSPTVWSFRLLDTSPTGHFAYETFRLVPGHFAYTDCPFYLQNCRNKIRCVDY